MIPYEWSVGTWPGVLCVNETEVYAGDGAVLFPKLLTDENVSPGGVALVQFTGIGGTVL